VWAISGVVISVSYLGFLGSVEMPHRWAVPAIVCVSVLSTLGELIYAGSSTALVAATAPEHVLGRALARFQLSTGFSLAISPAIITALAARGPAALRVSLTAATLLAAAAVERRSLLHADARQSGQRRYRTETLRRLVFSIGMMRFRRRHGHRHRRRHGGRTLAGSPPAPLASACSGPVPSDDLPRMTRPRLRRSAPPTPPTVTSRTPSVTCVRCIRPGTQRLRFPYR
jgi:hypothetical protein